VTDPDRPAPGRGRRWIFLRGLAREQAHWGDFLSRFEAAFPGDRALAVDLPGCGAALAARSPARVEGLLRAVRDSALRSELAGPTHVFAISLGGLVAHEWLRRHPEELAGVVLVNASLGGASPPWRRLRPGGALGLARAALARHPEERERRILAVVSARPGAAAAALPGWTAAARARPVSAATLVRQLLAAATYRSPELLAGAGSASRPASPPTLVLAGAADRLVHPGCSRALVARLGPGATLAEHPSAGHDLPLDEPEWVIGEVRAWLAAPSGLGSLL
jgi:pimeloyl-ACP methyl ester carboxylesterase